MSDQIVFQISTPAPSSVDAITTRGSKIDLLATNIAAIDGVYDDLSGADTIGTVAADLLGANYTGQVAGNIANVNIVAGMSASVEAVADIDAEVILTSGISASIVTLSGAIEDGTLASAINWAAPAVKTKTELRGLTYTPVDGQGFILSGRDTTGDGGEGLCVWEAGDQSSNVSADEVTSSEGDGGVWFTLTSNKSGTAGAFRYLDTGEINLARYVATGATGSAVKTAIEAASAQSDRIIIDNDYTTDAPNIEATANASFFGSGALTGIYRKQVIPLDAGQHTPKNTSITTFTENPVVVLVGDSISTYLANANGRGDMLSGAIEQWLSEQLGQGGFTFYNRAIGGKTYSNFNAAAPGSGNQPSGVEWWTDGTQSWQDLVEQLSPDIIIFSFGMNDGATLDPDDLDAAISWASNLETLPQSVLATCVRPALDPTDSQYGVRSEQDTRDQACGLVRSYANRLNIPCLDFGRQFVAVRDGYDEVDSILIDDEETITEVSDVWSGSKEVIDCLYRVSLDVSELVDDTTDPDASVVIQVGAGPLDWLRISKTAGGNIRWRLSSGPAGAADNYQNLQQGTWFASDVELYIEISGNRISVWLSTTGNGFGQTVAPLFSEVLYRYGGWFTPQVTDASGAAFVTAVKMLYARPRAYTPQVKDRQLFALGDGAGSGYNHPGNYLGPWVYAAVLAQAQIAPRGAIGARSFPLLANAVITGPTLTALDTSQTYGDGGPYAYSFAVTGKTQITWAIPEDMTLTSITLRYAEKTGGAGVGLVYAFYAYRTDPGSVVSVVNGPIGTATLATPTNGEGATLSVPWSISLKRGDQIAFVRNGDGANDTYDVFQLLDAVLIQ